MPQILSRTCSTVSTSPTNSSSSSSSSSSSTKKLFHLIKKTVSPSHPKSNSTYSSNSDTNSNSTNSHYNKNRGHSHSHDHQHRSNSTLSKQSSHFKLDSRSSTGSSALSSSSFSSSTSSIPRSANSLSKELSSIPEPKELQLPDNWQMRFDPVLTQVYYINTKENLIQFDNPLEVVKL